MINYEESLDLVLGTIYSEFVSELNSIIIMQRIIPKAPYTGEEEERSNFEDTLNDINYDIEKIYTKMLYLNMHIIVEETLGKVCKALLIKYPDIIGNERKVSEHYVDKYIEDIKNNITKRAKEINKICKNRLDISLDDEFIYQIEKFRIERNVLVHSKGRISKQALKEFKRLDSNLDISLGDKVIYTQDKISNIIQLCEDSLEVLYCKVNNKINPNKYIEPISFTEFTKRIKNQA